MYFFLYYLRNLCSSVANNIIFLKFNPPDQSGPGSVSFFIRWQLFGVLAVFVFGGFDGFGDYPGHSYQFVVIAQAD